MSSPYFTTDLNVAIWLVYNGYEVLQLEIQPSNRGGGWKAMFYFDNEAMKEVEEFYNAPEILVDMRKINKIRHEIVGRINKAKQEMR